MPLNTDLNVSPYFDDYDPSKNYYKVLFQPGVAVQVRELNQLSTLLQAQIERFGDNIFRRGTIVSGCNFSFFSNFSYVKILDNTNDGQPISAGLFKNAIVKGSITGLSAYVVETASGFVATDPNLNTLFVRYTNSGSNTNSTAFVNNEILTITDNLNSIRNVPILTGGSQFSNNDLPVFVSAITIANTTGGNSFVNSSAGACTFVVGTTVTGSVSNAHLVITGVDTTTNASAIILNIKPQITDLQVTPVNTNLWMLQTGENISVTNGVQTANVTAIIGSGTQGTVITDSSGIVDDIALTSGGSGYYVAPYATIASATGSLLTLALQAENFIAQVNVATVTDSTGFGYAFGVTEGVIFQKGFFLRVNPQLIIVDKYDNQPDQVSVGFSTTESIVNSAIDNSLYDNATGEPNFTAPGADRLQLTPTLVVQDKQTADANDQFYSIVSFSGGSPYLQNRQTQYNQIEQEMARRTFDSSGNYVLDPYYINTQSANTLTIEGNNVSGTFTTIIDPGSAYIEGYKVETQYNFYQPISKGTDTSTVNNAVILNYGNYIRINNVGGMFVFNSGDIVTLYDTAKNFLGTSSVFTGSLTPSGTVLGTARIRSFVYESGSDVGTPGAVYRLYLFDINMASGGNFRNVRSVYYNNAGLSITAVGDAITVTDPTTGNQITQLVNQSGNSQLVFSSGQSALKNANNVTYSYRTVRTATANTSGIITITAPEGVFPYGNSTVLSAGQEQDIIIVPTANARAASNLAGSIAVTSSSNVVTGTSTTFTSSISVGDYIGLWSNSTNTSVKRITGIANDISLSIDSNAGFTNATANVVAMFPQNIPIAISSRNARTANTNNNGSVLTVYVGTNLANATTVDTAFNIQVANAQPVTKVVNRDVFVRLSLANVGIDGVGGTANTTGPWLLGVPDIFRLKAVYRGTTNSVSNTNTDITGNFFVDHNQNQDYYNVGYLYQTPTSNLVLDSSTWLLVQFDCFTKGSNGYFDVKSYTVDDTRTLGNLSSTGTYINTLEIPEFYSSDSQYFDLRDCFDFRPVSANSAALSVVSSTSTINPQLPSNAAMFGNTADITNDKKFPVPTSTLYSTLEYYKGRVDTIVVNSNNNFKVVKGIPGSNSAPSAPESSIAIGQLVVPPYPSLPTKLSFDVVSIADKKIANEKNLYQRQIAYTIQVPSTNASVFAPQPRGYTMEQIGRLERRIQNLEYIQNLNSLESAVSNQVIPSSANTQQNRFKFGFFVDAFQDQNFSDITNPQYNATIVDGNLTAKKSQINLPLEFGANSNPANKIAILPYQDYSVIQQLNATDGPVPVVNSTPVVVPTVPTQTRVCVPVQSINNQYDTSGNIVEVTSFTFSTTDGPADIYFDLLPNPDKVEVYQNSVSNFLWTAQSPIVSTTSAVLLSSGERANLTANGALAGIAYRGNNGWSIQNRPDYTPYPGSSANGFIVDAGRLSWTHIADNGQYYQIVVRKKSTNYSYYICFPTDANSVVSNTIQTQLAPTIYNGTVVSVDPNHFTIFNPDVPKVPNDMGFFISTSGGARFYAGTYTNPADLPPTGSMADMRFTVVAVGLKPSTSHQFVFDNSNDTGFCIQNNGDRGTLTTGSDGTLTFDYYYASQISRAFSNTYGIADINGYNIMQYYHDIVYKLVGVKQFTIQNVDNTSQANSMVTIAELDGSLPIANAVSGVVTPSPVVGGGKGPGPGTHTNDL